MRTHTLELQELGIIRQSTSPWCSSSVTVGKKDGSLRLCRDYRPLNSITVSDPYCMKRIDDMLDLLGEACFLTKLDLAKVYCQICMGESDVQKTAFSTPFGKFEFVRMPFGLKNAPTHFQRSMDIVLSELFLCSSAYIDDVIIFSMTIYVMLIMLCMLCAVMVLPLNPPSVSGLLAQSSTWVLKWVRVSCQFLSQEFTLSTPSLNLRLFSNSDHF